MIIRPGIVTALGASILSLLPAAASEEIKARGVNPAENDTRADVLLKHNWLTNRSSIFTTTWKFDYRVTPEIGFNIEFPVVGHFRSPSPAPGIPGLSDTGVGDVFARVRYIVPIGVGALGATSVGAAVEGVFPTASEKTLGGGTYQVNVTGLVVQAWSPTLITAFVAKATQSVHALDQRRSVQENTLRVVQAIILPRGMFATLDGRYNWETLNQRDRWWETQVEFGMMLDARTAASVSYARKFGDREDRGAVTAAFKRFF